MGNHPMEPVQLAIEDKNCWGVTSPDGKVRYDAKDHVVEVPRAEAERLLGTGHPMISTYRKYWGGVNMKELEERAKQWERMRESWPTTSTR
ncbi:hypothetical protein [Alicyclobacillus vulcanalis]|uniref:Uncharacterized protein n=1 Tax=Alicyclobacillus vulcanalis TaxID=252246 RepID=A0A1N7MRG4_9BACL|nr:hypothetical protein [Alicyclobacillus vulcanalis]SIS88439.1 hypothetical protein SAMN05421799_10636 [Alicyclobacillus vulcanalis]